MEIDVGRVHGMIEGSSYLSMFGFLHVHSKHHIEAELAIQLTLPHSFENRIWTFDPIITIVTELFLP